MPRGKWLTHVRILATCPAGAACVGHVMSMCRVPPLGCERAFVVATLVCTAASYRTLCVFLGDLGGELVAVTRPRSVLDGVVYICAK